MPGGLLMCRACGKPLKSRFGISRLIHADSCEYFAAHHWPVADFFAGVFLSAQVPVPIAFWFVWLLSEGRSPGCIFVFFDGLPAGKSYLCRIYSSWQHHPWYAMNYGFEPVLNTPGNVAGLGRFDELLGVLCLSFHLWTERQCVCCCSFIACGLYMVVAVAYAIMGRCKNG